MRFKISLLLIFLVTSVLLGSAMFSYYSLRGTLETQFEQRKQEVARRLQTSLSNAAWNFDKVTAIGALDGELASPEVQAIQAYVRVNRTDELFVSRAKDSDGRIVQTSAEEIVGSDVLRLPLFELQIDTPEQAGKARDVGHVLVSFSHRSVEQSLGQLLRNRFVEIGLLNLILGLVLYFVLSRMVINPLAQLSRAFKSLADNSQVGEISIEQSDEFGEVVAAFNQIERRLVSDIERRSEAEKRLQASNEELSEALASLKLMQDSLIQSEKFASLGSLVAGVAHEINTPVGIAVTGASYLVEETRKVDKMMREGGLKKSELIQFISASLEGAQLVLSNAERAAHLINSFKQVAADEISEARRPFNLNDYLDEVLTSLRPKYKSTQIKVEYSCPPLLEMDTYPGLLAQVLTNLLTNALTHGFDEGVEGMISIRVMADEPWVNIECANNGKLIPPEHLNKVFEPFFTTRRARGGTGLGLNIVFNIVTQRLGGTVKVLSNRDDGTRFTLRIPRVLGDKIT